MDVIGMVASPLAAAETVLTTDEKDLGVALLDIGGGTTDLSIFQNGSLVHTSVLPLGGEQLHQRHGRGACAPHLRGRRTSSRDTACALGSLVDDDDVNAGVPSMGGRKPRLLTRQDCSRRDHPAARLEEISTWPSVKDGLGPEQRNELKLHSGIVITGGGATLKGLPELAEQIFELPVRMGTCRTTSDDAHRRGPPGRFATALGLTRYVQRQPDHRRHRPRSRTVRRPRMVGLSAARSRRSGSITI